MHRADLEDYLRTACVVHAAQLAGGGGHQRKQLLVLDGGLGVVAKLAEAGDPAARSTAAQQVRGEVAAWLLASELGWDDLVPVTTLGVVESLYSGEHVAASLQVVWPRFKLAGELGLKPENCAEAERWRVAIFDALAGNTDRNATNWGHIDGLDRPKLIDHGNGFGAAPTNSEFATQLIGQPIPERCVQHLKEFVANEKGSRLSSALPDATLGALFSRAQLLVQNGTFSV